MSLHYYPGKANIVVDTLSRMSMGSLSYVNEDKWYFVKEIHHLVNLGISLSYSKDGGVIIQEVVRPSLGAEVKQKQVLDHILMQITNAKGKKRVMVF